MKAFVTGAAGFIGRHMVRTLRERGWRVSGCDVVRADGIAWLSALEWFAKDRQQYDLVVHAAASSPHRAAIDTEPLHFALNLQLDAAMFDWARRTAQPHVVYLSSSAVYPTALQRVLDVTQLGDTRPRHLPLYVGDRGLAESDCDPHGDIIGQPDAVYGWTKLTGERLADQARAAGVGVTVVRPFSGYGEDQAPTFPFRAIIERARRRDARFEIWGDGSQVRDWIHVDDVIDATLATVQARTPGPINICTGVGHSMLELAQLACKTVGYDPEFELRLDKPAGVAHRVGDPTQLQRHYTAQITLAEGVERALRG